jgi:hypothetical protein
MADLNNLCSSIAGSRFKLNPLWDMQKSNISKFIFL